MYSFIVMDVQPIEVANVFVMANFLVIKKSDYEIVMQHLTVHSVPPKIRVVVIEHIDFFVHQAYLCKNLKEHYVTNHIVTSINVVMHLIKNLLICMPIRKEDCNNI